jgi:putative DNA primase/helicase
MISTVERARGRWREILTKLGVEERFLHNRHGPCPACGGKDRFRFDDRDGEGTYYCNQCGAGTGLILLRKLHGWTHKEACDAVDEIIGKSPTRQPAMQRQEGPSSESREAAVKRLLAEANDDSVVGCYLARRGLSVLSPVLKGHPRCPYFNGGTKLLGRYPAVLAPITARDGQLESVQRIYDADLQPRKKILTPARSINGAAVRLFEPTDELAITEGVETALAVRQMYGLPVWAALSANGLATFQPPPGLIRLHIFGDNDANFVGQAAANALAARISRKGDIEVTMNTPPDVDTDWLDVLNGRAAA